MRFYMIHSANKYARHIDLDFSALYQSILWIHLDEPITERELISLSYAIPDMKGIYWDLKYIIGDRADLTLTQTTAEFFDTSDTNVVKSILDYSYTNVNTKFHQRLTRMDSTWIDNSNSGELSRSIRLSQTNEMIAIIPHNDIAAWQWANIMYGMAWYKLWDFSERINKKKPTEWQKKVFDVDHIILNYLSLTQYIGGIPSLPTIDINAHPGLIFFGTVERLEQIAQSLLQVGNPYSDAEFERYYNRYSPSLSHRR